MFPLFTAHFRVFRASFWASLLLLYSLILVVRLYVCCCWLVFLLFHDGCPSAGFRPLDLPDIALSDRTSVKASKDHFHGCSTARARVDYDYLIKLLLIGDSGVGKSCLLLRFSDGSFTTSFITTIGELDGKRIKLQIWDSAGQERFRTITTAYYRGAMGILLVYDVTDESSFNRIGIRYIEQHASDNVNKILVGNKTDMDESKRAVPTSSGQALADEYGIKFFETSAKTSLNVKELFFSIGRDIKQRLAESDSKAEQPGALTISAQDPAASGSDAHKSLPAVVRKRKPTLPLLIFEIGLRRGLSSG